MEGSSRRDVPEKKSEGYVSDEGLLSSSSSSDKEKDRMFSIFSPSVDAQQRDQQQKKSYDERVKEVREREARERQRKLDQMLNALQRAEEARKKQDVERMKKRKELKLREDERRMMVDERRKRLEEEDSEKKQAMLKKYEELTRKIVDLRSLPKLSPVPFRKTASDEADDDDGGKQARIRLRPHSNPTHLPSYSTENNASNLRSGRSPQKAPAERKFATARIVSASPELSRRALRSGERSRARRRNHSGSNKQVVSPTPTGNVEMALNDIMTSSMSRLTGKQSAPDREVYVMSRSLEAAYLSSMFDSRPKRRYLPQTPGSRIARPVGPYEELGKLSRDSPKLTRESPVPRESPRPSKLPTVVRAASAPAGVRFSEVPSPPLPAVVHMEAVRCGTRSLMNSPSVQRRVRSKIPKVLPCEPGGADGGQTFNGSSSKNARHTRSPGPVLRSSSSTATSPKPALRKIRHRRSASSPGGAVRQVTFTPDVMAASMASAADEAAADEAREREYKRKLAERRQLERDRRVELTLAAERKAKEEAERLSVEELKLREAEAARLEAEKKAEEERLMRLMEDEYKSKLEQMERLEKKRQSSRRAYEERIERERQEYRLKQEEERLERRRKFELIKLKLKSDLTEGKMAQEIGAAPADPTSSDVIKIIHESCSKTEGATAKKLFKSARLNQMFQRSPPSSDEA